MIMKECRWGIVCSGEPGGVWMATLHFLYVMTVLVNIFDIQFNWAFVSVILCSFDDVSRFIVGDSLIFA